MNFKNFYIESDEKNEVKKDNKNDDKSKITKIIKLNTMEIEIQYTTDKDGLSYINIKSLKDPNLKGRIYYDNEEDVKIAYDALENDIELLNYMYFNSQNNMESYKLADIVSREINVFIKIYDEDEFNELGYEFPVSYPTDLGDMGEM